MVTAILNQDSAQQHGVPDALLLGKDAFPTTSSPPPLLTSSVPHLDTRNSQPLPTFHHHTASPSSNTHSTPHADAIERAPPPLLQRSPATDNKDALSALTLLSFATSAKTHGNSASAVDHPLSTPLPSTQHNTAITPQSSPPVLYPHPHAATNGVFPLPLLPDKGLLMTSHSAALQPSAAHDLFLQRQAVLLLQQQHEHHQQQQAAFLGSGGASGSNGLTTPTPAAAASSPATGLVMPPSSLTFPSSLNGHLIYPGIMHHHTTQPNNTNTTTITANTTTTSTGSSNAASSQQQQEEDKRVKLASSFTTLPTHKDVWTLLQQQPWLSVPHTAPPAPTERQAHPDVSTSPFHAAVHSSSEPRASNAASPAGSVVDDAGLSSADDASVHRGNLPKPSETAAEYNATNIWSGGPQRFFMNPPSSHSGSSQFYADGASLNDAASLSRLHHAKGAVSPTEHLRVLNNSSTTSAAIPSNVFVVPTLATATAASSPQQPQQWPPAASTSAGPLNASFTPQPGGGEFAAMVLPAATFQQPAAPAFGGAAKPVGASYVLLPQHQQARAAALSEQVLPFFTAPPQPQRQPSQQQQHAAAQVAFGARFIPNGFLVQSAQLNEAAAKASGVMPTRVATTTGQPTVSPTASDTTAAAAKSGHRRPQSQVLCRLEGCNEPACGSRAGFCAAHAYGPRRCEYPGCTKCAQGGARKFCISHGGGRRCQHPGCTKGARDRFYCAAHGGGKRCKEPGCTKGAVGGTERCTAHGGGRRCKSTGCPRSAQSGTNFCVCHGGGRTCRVEKCSRVARGRSLFCASHRSAQQCPHHGCERYSMNYNGLCDDHQPSRIVHLPDIVNAASSQHSPLVATVATSPLGSGGGTVNTPIVLSPTQPPLRDNAILTSVSSPQQADASDHSQNRQPQQTTSNSPTDHATVAAAHQSLAGAQHSPNGGYALPTLHKLVWNHPIAMAASALPQNYALPSIGSAALNRNNTLDAAAPASTPLSIGLSASSTAGYPLQVSKPQAPVYGNLAVQLSR